MKRTAFAWIVFGMTAACVIGAAFLPDEDWERSSIVILGIAVVFTSACGALIASRRSDNATGWILLAIAFSIASGLLATQWANRALVDHPGSIPGGSAAAWFQSWLWTPLSGLFALLVLLFPTGHVLSRRWRLIGWVIGASAVLVCISVAFDPGPFQTFPKVQNPLGVEVFSRAPDLFGALAGVWITTIPAAMLSLFLRFRRATSAERQQIKWFFFATTAAIVLILLNPLTFALNGGRDPVVFGVSTGFAFPIIAFALLPASIALAILRHRLYDIDRIISRTLSYAVITALLGGTFALVVLVPAAAFGTGRRPDWLVAVATLSVAALFRPVRRRVQRVVDQRFNRARYDAEHTIALFTTRLRAQIDIDALGMELCAVVNTTVQPSRVSLWLPGKP
jgi:MFS family permease